MITLLRRLSKHRAAKLATSDNRVQNEGVVVEDVGADLEEDLELQIREEERFTPVRTRPDLGLRAQE